MNMLLTLIEELSAIIVLSAFLAYLFSKLKQPVIISYILTGFIIGPAVFGLVNSYEEIQAMSELGIALLLFAIGAELDLEKIKHIRKGIILSTIAEVAITLGIGFSITYFLLHYTLIQSLFIGTIVSMSSTAVVMKYLTDRKMASTLRARIMLSVLIIQDLLVMFFLPLLMNISSDFHYSIILIIIGKILLIVAVAMLLRYFINDLMKDTVKNKDLVFLISLASSFGFIFLSSLLHFSIIIGAFIGGLILTNYPYHLEILSEIYDIKTFFSMFFFVLLGMQITTLSNLSWGLFALLFFLSFMVKPFILFVGSILNKYDLNTSFYTSTGLSQISAFSLVLVQYASLNFIFSDSLNSNLIIFISLSMIATPYILKFNKEIEHMFMFGIKPVENILKKLFKVKTQNLISKSEKIELKDHIILFGLGRMGYSIFDSLVESSKYPVNKIVVIDDDPEPIENAIKAGAYGICGQADNEEILETLNINKARLVIISIPYFDVNKKILKYIDTKKTMVFSRAYYIQEAYELYKKGVDFVVVPQVLATNQIIKEIFTYLDNGKSKTSGLDLLYLDSLKKAANEEKFYRRHHRYMEY